MKLTLVSPLAIDAIIVGELSPNEFLYPTFIVALLKSLTDNVNSSGSSINKKFSSLMLGP